MFKKKVIFTSDFEDFIGLDQGFVTDFFRSKFCLNLWNVLNIS